MCKELCSGNDSNYRVDNTTKLKDEIVSYTLVLFAFILFAADNFIVSVIYGVKRRAPFISSIIGEKPVAKNFFPYSLDQFTFFKTITWRHF